MIKTVRSKQYGTQMKVYNLRFILFSIILVSLSACSFGPPEKRAKMEQVLRQGYTDTAYVVVKAMEVREPTGFINTFPNGGNLWILNQSVKVYEVHAQDQTVRLLVDFPANDSNWGAFGGYMAGFDDQEIPYLRIFGCEKGGECHDDLMRYSYFRLNPQGTFEPISELPVTTALPATRGFPWPGEKHYVRFSLYADTLKAKFEVDGKYQSLFEIDQAGRLYAVN